MNAIQMPIEESYLRQLDAIRHILSAEEAMLLDAFIGAHNTLATIDGFLSVGATGSAQVASQSQGMQRRDYLQQYIDFKKKQETA